MTHLSTGTLALDRVGIFHAIRALMHKDSALTSATDTGGNFGSPVGEPSRQAPQNSNFPRVPVQNSPFSQAAPEDRRPRLFETTNELSPFPEEGDPVYLNSSDAPLPTVRWGVATSKGQRQQMEDAHMGVPVLDLPDSCPFHQNSSFFGVFDGHGGVEAAEFARDNLLQLVLKDNAFASHPGTAMNSAFVELDEQFYKAVLDEKPPHSSGSTVLAALLQGSRLHIANAGDSRAVISKRGRAEELSKDHRPNSRSEQDRIKQCGGFISDEYLNGHLSVTRGIGDYHVAKLKEKKRQDGPFSGPLTAEPEIQIRTLSPEDEFLVLACDGLWDVWPSQRVIELARQHLRLNNNDPQACAEFLVEESEAKHVSDNVTVLVICLTPEAPPKRDCGDLKRSVSQNGFKSLKHALQNASA